MANNVNDWYCDVLYKMRGAPIENSRNGQVRACQTAELFVVYNPLERVLFNPQRRCNPYLHVMETVWMFAGSKDVKFLLPFSKQMEKYAEANGTINGAYGHRWRNHFERDQIMGVMRELRDDPESRQAVIAMYDPRQDYRGHWKDRPCNTHLYFRIVDGALDMTVCNRSNDAVWGMCGANAVHMTYLQELVAHSLQCRVGKYQVMTNNLHLYKHHWHYLDNPLNFDHYEDPNIVPYPLMSAKETDIWEFMAECRTFVDNNIDGHYQSSWINNVVIPMYEHYMCRLSGNYNTYDTSENKATDWRLAEDHWRQSHDN